MYQRRVDEASVSTRETDHFAGTSTITVPSRNLQHIEEAVFCVLTGGPKRCRCRVDGEKLADLKFVIGCASGEHMVS